MKKVICPMAILLISCANQPEGYVINGITSDFSDSTLVYLSLDETDFDSAYVIDNKFSFEGKVEDGFSSMWIHTKDYREYKSIWVINKEMTFDASHSSFRMARVEGSRIQDQSNEYEAVTAPFKVKMDSIRDLVKTSSLESAKDELRKQYEILTEQKHESEVNFIRRHPEYELSAFFLDYLKSYIEKETTKELYDGLVDNVRNSEWGKSISLHIEKSVKLEVGDKAVDFTLSTIDGKEVSLSDFKGKYVLLEFWATGCAPCRRENPNLRKAYEKFKSAGFEILGVSLDKKRSHWQSTIAKDSISWTTVGDLKGMSGEVPITYSVNYIPKSYLFNEEGIVVAKFNLTSSGNYHRQTL